MLILISTNILVTELVLVEVIFIHLFNGFDRNVIFFRVDMSSSVHVDNKGKEILILGKGPTQGLKTFINHRKNVSS